MVPTRPPRRVKRSLLASEGETSVKYPEFEIFLSAPAAMFFSVGPMVPACTLTLDASVCLMVTISAILLVFRSVNMFTSLFLDFDFCLLSFSFYSFQIAGH